MEKRLRSNMPLTELQLWDCFSYDITIIQKVLLVVVCKYMSPEKKWHKGHYWWIIDSCASSALERDVSFSETPSQHKSFNIIAFVNAYHIAAQPNNRVIFYDKSLSPSKLKFPDFKVSTVEYEVEGTHKWTAGDTDDWHYELKDLKMSKSVFNKNKGLDATKQPMFFGEDLAVQRYDTFKYPVFDKLNQTQLGYFWRPEEVSLQKDRNDFLELRDEQEVYLYV